MGGRRAKYKQAPPEPLPEHTSDCLSSKKLGKRKAGVDTDGDSGPERPVYAPPAKKAKAVNKIPEKRPQNGKGGMLAVRSPKNTAVSASLNGKGKKRDEELREIESGGDSEGWEDVSDGGAFVDNLSDVGSDLDE